jgi:probable phosphoglycerate mutase
MPVHLILVRHGQTDANAAGIIQGHLPTPLNPLGARQMDRLARRLETYTPPVTRLISSDLPRALQSARPIASALGLPVESDPLWRERGYGALEGLSPEAREALRRSIGEEAAGVEAADLFHARVRAALLSVAHGRDAPPRLRESAGVTLVVSHGGFIRAVVRLLQSETLPCRGAPPPLEVIANASICHLAWDRGGWETLAFNDVAHLERDERTSGDADSHRS